jgi:hypothetical protein
VERDTQKLALAAVAVTLELRSLQAFVSTAVTTNARSDGLRRFDDKTLHLGKEAALPSPMC